MTEIQRARVVKQNGNTYAEQPTTYHRRREEIEYSGIVSKSWEIRKKSGSYIYNVHIFCIMTMTI